MALTHKKVVQYVTDEGRLSNTTETVTGDGEVSYEGAVAHNATPANSEKEVDLAFVEADIKSLLIYTSAAAITVRSNANHLGSPGDTVAIPAGRALIWNTNDLGDNPFATADVTKLYITNESATLDTDVKIRVLVDVTP